jgi:tetratricopeptide (TPR) repeat protein
VAEPSKIIGMLDCALVQGWPSLQNACVAFAARSDTEQFTAIGGTLAVVGGGALAFLKLVLPLLKKKPAKPAAVSNFVQANPISTVSPVISPQNTQTNQQTVNITTPPAASPTLGSAIDQADSLSKDDALLVIQRLAKKHGLSTEVAAEATKRFTEATDALPAAAQAINKPNTLAIAFESLKQGRTYEAEGIFKQLAADKEREGKASFKEAAEALRHLAAFSFINDKANALITLKRAAGLDPDSYSIQLDLGDVARDAGNLHVAEAAYRRLLNFAELSQDDDILSLILDRLVEVTLAKGECRSALNFAKKAQDIDRRRADLQPFDSDLQRDLSVSCEKIGSVLLAKGKHNEALANFRSSLKIREALVCSNSKSIQWQRDLSVSHNRIGDVLMEQGKHNEAIASFRSSLRIRQTLVCSVSDDTELQRDLSVSHNKIGYALMIQGKKDEALVSYHSGLSIAETLALSDPSNAEWQRDLVVSYVKISIADIALAPKLLQQALDIVRKLDKDGKLAPVDAFMLEDIKGRLAASQRVKS